MSVSNKKYTLSVFALLCLLSSFSIFGMAKGTVQKKREVLSDKMETVTERRSEEIDKLFDDLDFNAGKTLVGLLKSFFKVVIGSCSNKEQELHKKKD